MNAERRRERQSECGAEERQRNANDERGEGRKGMRDSMQQQNLRRNPAD